MKKSSIIIVLVVIVAAVLFFLNKANATETATDGNEDTSSGDSGALTSNQRAKWKSLLQSWINNYTKNWHKNDPEKQIMAAIYEAHNALKNQGNLAKFGVDGLNYPQTQQMLIDEGLTETLRTY